METWAKVGIGVGAVAVVGVGGYLAYRKWGKPATPAALPVAAAPPPRQLPGQQQIDDGHSLPPGYQQQQPKGAPIYWTAPDGSVKTYTCVGATPSIADMAGFQDVVIAAWGSGQAAAANAQIGDGSGKWVPAWQTDWFKQFEHAGPPQLAQPGQQQEMPPPLPAPPTSYGILAEDYRGLVGQLLYWDASARRLVNNHGTPMGTDEQNLVRLVRLADGSAVDIEVYVQPSGKPYQPSSAKPVNGSATLPTGPDFMVTAPPPKYSNMKSTPLGGGHLGFGSGAAVGARAVTWRELRRRVLV